MVHPCPTRRSIPGLALALVLTLALAVPADSGQAQDGCHTTVFGSGRVGSVGDGRTLMLADGREVRLAGLAPDSGGREALRLLAGGKRVQLARLGAGGKPDIDRYGRLVAFVTVDSAPQSLQMALLTVGQARVLGRIRRQNLRRRPFSDRKRGPDRQTRALGQPQFRPFKFRKSPRS